MALTTEELRAIFETANYWGGDDVWGIAGQGL